MAIELAGRGPGRGRDATSGVASGITADRPTTDHHDGRPDREMLAVEAPGHATPSGGRAVALNDPALADRKRRADVRFMLRRYDQSVRFAA